MPGFSQTNMSIQRCMNKDLLLIDGSFGEGGGQILRTSLALSAILKRPVQIKGIRAGRDPSGLRPQHLKTIEALAQVTGAEAEGVRIGSERILFSPGKTVAGEYSFDVATAASVTLLLQGLLPPLCFGQGLSRLRLTGGTHVPWSPPYHYFSRILVPTLRRMGIVLRTKLERWGWYPMGGGIVDVEIEPTSGLRPISLTERGKVKGVFGLSASSNLPSHVVSRQKDRAAERLEKELGLYVEIETNDRAPALGAGSFLFLGVETEGGLAGFSSLAEKGKPAERVADEGVDSLKTYLFSEGALDPNLSDQIVLFMALAQGTSSFTVTRMTEHLLTNLWVVSQFLDVRITKSRGEGESGRVDLVAQGF